MKNRTDTMLRSLAKASKRATQLHATLLAVEQLMPESTAWHDMSAAARHLELRIETMLAMIEEILERDPETYVALLLKLDALDGSGNGGSPWDSSAPQPA